MKHLLTVTVLSLFTLGLFAKEYPVLTIDYSTSLFQLAPDSTDTCLGVTIVILDTVYDNQNPCEIRIGVTGGTLPYSFYWTGPNAYTSTVQNPNDMPYPGVYNVLVTDSLGCTGSIDSYTSCGIGSVAELNFAKSTSIFPNPNHGKFTLKADNVENGNYTISIKNIVGQVVFEDAFFAHGSISKEFELPNVPIGVYFLELANEVGESSIIKILIK